MVDNAKKTLVPADPSGKAAFDALAKTSAAQGKKAGRQPKARKGKTAAPAAQEPAAPAAKAKGKAAAGKKAAKPEDEYEYVYEEE